MSNVNGSSGECIYQSVEDRKIVLENVMKVAEGKLTVIAMWPAITRRTVRSLPDMQKGWG